MSYRKQKQAEDKYQLCRREILIKLRADNPHATNRDIARMLNLTEQGLRKWEREEGLTPVRCVKYDDPAAADPREATR